MSAWRTEAPTVEEVKARQAAGLPCAMWWRQSDKHRLRAVELSVTHGGLIVVNASISIAAIDGEWGGWCLPPSCAPPGSAPSLNSMHAAAVEVLAGVEGAADRLARDVMALFTAPERNPTGSAVRGRIDRVSGTVEGGRGYELRIVVEKEPGAPVPPEHMPGRAVTVTPAGEKGPTK